MEIRARIELLSSMDGGRLDPLRGSFRPNHKFATADSFSIGEVRQNAQALLFPGNTIDCVVRFVPESVPPLATGMRWALYEGPNHLIGYGTVLEMFNNEAP